MAYMRKSFPVEGIEAALSAREHGSFSAAASALNTTHAAISRRVKMAESWAGRALFERHGRGVRTTREGERLLARLEAMLHSIDQLVEHRRPKSRRTLVRIATTPSFFRYRLLPHLTQLEADDLRLEIIADVRTRELRGTEIDLAFRYGLGNWRVGVETALERGPLVPVMPRKFLNSGQINEPQIDVGGIGEMPLLHNAETTLWRAWLTTHGLNRRNSSNDRTMFDYASTLAAAEMGFGVALFDTAMHQLNDLSDALVAAQTCPLDAPPMGYHAIVPHGAGHLGQVVLRRLLGSGG